MKGKVGAADAGEQQRVAYRIRSACLTSNVQRRVLVVVSDVQPGLVLQQRLNHLQKDKKIKF